MEKYWTKLYKWNSQRQTQIKNPNLRKLCFCVYYLIGRNTKIIFNPGYILKYLHKYINDGFIPLDEEEKNSYEKSQMKNVTDEFIDILIKNGKSIISNKNISNSDINQIYHIIFEFTTNISFKHSYIIQKSFIKQFIDKYSKEKLDDMDFEFYYVCLKYILNSSKYPKSILKNLILNLAKYSYSYDARKSRKYQFN